MTTPHTPNPFHAGTMTVEEWGAKLDANAPHTKTPWKTGNRYPTRIMGLVTTATYHAVANTANAQDEDMPSELEKANAAHIVKCVNERDTLLRERDALREAAKATLAWLEHPDLAQWRYMEGSGFYEDKDTHVKWLTTALATAGGTSES